MVRLARERGREEEEAQRLQMSYDPIGHIAQPIEIICQSNKQNSKEHYSLYNCFKFLLL